MQSRGQKQLMWRAGAELAGGVERAESALNSWRSSRSESRADSALYRPPLAEGAADLRLLLSLQQGTSMLQHQITGRVFGILKSVCRGAAYL